MEEFELIIERCQRQEILFADNPSRLTLNKLSSEINDSLKRYKIKIWRNHAVEPLVDYIDIYTSLNGYYLDYQFSDYDDTLSFNEINESDLNVLWIDLERYDINNLEDWINWFYLRIKDLRELVKSPILIITLEKGEKIFKLIKESLSVFAGVFVANIFSSMISSNISIYEKRYEQISGTCLNKKIHILVARLFACQWLPTLLFEPIKAVAVDLDNTLYSGILGEDGSKNLVISKGHIALQNFLKKLKEKGVFLILISKNEMKDVHNLFNDRSDLILQLDDFSHLEVSWDEKSIGLKRSAKSLNISVNSILFVDDNIGELSSVWINDKSFKAIHAKEDAFLTLNALRFFPGIWRWNVNKDDFLRTFDMNSQNERNKLLNNSQSIENYLSSLKVELTYNYDFKKELKRLFELSRKTNQFNFSLRRTSEYELDEFIKSESHAVVSVSLRDKLSDSGIVAVIIAKKANRSIFILDLCISCRALGRKLEDLIILPSIINMKFFKDIDFVDFDLRKGPRNKPALDWFDSFSKNINGSHKIAKNTILNKTNMLDSIKFNFNFG